MAPGARVQREQAPPQLACPSLQRSRKASATEIGIDQQFGDLRPVGLVRRRVVARLNRSRDPADALRDQQHPRAVAHRRKHFVAPEGIAVVLRQSYTWPYLNVLVCPRRYAPGLSRPAPLLMCLVVRSATVRAASLVWRKGDHP